MNNEYCKHYDIVKLLLERGAEINHRTDIVHSALYYAAIYGHEDMVEYLLDRGAQIEITDEWRQGRLLWAAMKGHVQVVKILLKREADLMTMRILLLFGFHISQDEPPCQVFSSDKQIVPFSYRFGLTRYPKEW